ncbi:AAA family ATPase [Petrimonas sp.]|uniref:AAA family ATPase n=1 Tax=Petrimonas sp. TaxID=2023866 RepID=UPI0030D59BA8
MLGPRQCGKSTLVKMLYQNSNAYLYLDLQNLDDLNKLREPMLFFQANQDVTICLDEIQLVPELFSVLRSEIDRHRRPGRFILLGSASQDLIQKTSESLSVTYQTIRRYIDLMEQTFIIRSLPPFEKNIKKRLVKSPKIFVRDSGLLHRL